MITLAELYRHAADNIEAGRPETHGVECFNVSSGCWVKTLCSSMGAIVATITIKAGVEYRIAPKTIRIGDVDAPAPETEPLEMDQRYYVADPALKDKYRVYLWGATRYDRIRIERGVVHLTTEDAVAHANALIIISGGTVD